jgi:tetratricopeptide (TPR) repeat protein
MGRLPEAETAYTDALALLKQLASDFPNRPEFRQDLASCWNNLGILFHTNDRLKEAEAAFADALALQKQLAAAVPTTRRLRIDLSRSHNNLGNLLRVTGRPKEAEAAYADALALEKQLVADFPNRPEFRQLLASSHSNLGGVFLVTDRPKEAEAAVLAALAQFKQLAAEFPTRPDFGLGLANCHNCLGLLFYADRRLNEAEAAFANAIAIEEQLVADFAARTDFRVLLADSYTKAGLVFSDKGQQKDSDVALATAIALEKQLVADFPNQPMRQTNLLRAYRNLIYLRLEWREFKAAKTLLDEAMPYHETILKANPLDPDVRRLYQSNLQEMIQAHAGLGDVVEAKQTAVKLRDLGWDPPGNSYAAACGLSLCVPIVQKDDKTAKDARDKQVRYYADEAMLMLTEAVAKGYKDATSLKEELDLKPLRDREDFKRLVAELEKKAVIP